MGMFDEYIPRPPLSCPACGKILEGWQGKDGPCAVMIWRQGVATPIDQAIEDESVRLTDAERADFRLPEEFLIYTQCCASYFIEADCACNDNVWRRTELEKAETAVQGK
jgi:hypothetical protein